MNNHTRVFVGIDVAKASLDVAISDDQTVRRFPYHQAGLLRLAEYLQPLDPELIVMEATGKLEERLALFLTKAGLHVAIVNPRQVRDYARAFNQLAKTDRIDARVIASFAQTVRPREYQIPGQNEARLRALVVRRRQVIRSRTQERGELNKLGIHLARNTIKNILKRHGITPDPLRGEGRWDQFIKAHVQSLWACDFFCVKAWTARGLAEFYMLLFIHIGSRRMFITPCTKHPSGAWVAQQARNFCLHVQDSGLSIKYLIRDRDSKFHCLFDDNMKAEGATVIKLPVRSPDLNAIAERAIQSAKYENLNHFVIFGEKHLNYLTGVYVEFYNTCRPHSSVGHLPPCRDGPPPELTAGRVLCEERLGGLLKHYYREAA